jgi:hypothetical protein
MAIGLSAELVILLLFWVNLRLPKVKCDTGTANANAEAEKRTNEIVPVKHHAVKKCWGVEV